MGLFEKLRTRTLLNTGARNGCSTLGLLELKWEYAKLSNSKLEEIAKKNTIEATIAKEELQRRQNK